MFLCGCYDAASSTIEFAEQMQYAQRSIGTDCASGTFCIILPHPPFNCYGQLQAFQQCDPIKNQFMLEYSQGSISDAIRVNVGSLQGVGNRLTELDSRWRQIPSERHIGKVRGRMVDIVVQALSCKGSYAIPPQCQSLLLTVSFPNLQTEQPDLKPRFTERVKRMWRFLSCQIHAPQWVTASQCSRSMLLLF